MASEHGDIHWNELMTRDVAAAKTFYADTCGWSFNDVPMPMGFDYVLCMKGDAIVAGMMDMDKAGPQMEGIPPHWFTYVAVDDVDAAVTRAQGAGGTLQGEAFDVPNVGRIAIIQDASGAMVGIMTPAAQG